MYGILFGNNNKAIIAKLASRNLKADKSRNLFIMITIAFATCLIMATILYFLEVKELPATELKGCIREYKYS